MIPYSLKLVQAYAAAKGYYRNTRPTSETSTYGRILNGYGQTVGYSWRDLWTLQQDRIEQWMNNTTTP